MKIQVDITPNGRVVCEVLERSQGENCSTATQQLVQGMSIESDERTGPDCDEVHESMRDGSI